MISAPGTLRCSSATIRMKPAIASSVPGLCRSPSVTSVAGCAVMMPALLSPMIARKRPIPAEMANFSDRGMALTTASRTLNTLTAMNNKPEMNTAPSAACQVKPIPFTTAKAK